MSLRAVDLPGYEGDADLVARCLRGERAAERELFREQFGRIHATLYRVLGSARETEDLVQETFVEVFRSLRRFRGESRLATWIDRIAARVAFHHLGRRRPVLQLEVMAEQADEGAPPDERAQAREGLRRLYVALSELGPAARLAFTLHAIDGRPLGEVARLTGSALVATKLRVWRARRTLAARAALDPVLRAYVTGDAPARKQGREGARS